MTQPFFTMSGWPRRALVTGAGSGIGRALTVRLARTGSQVWICGRRKDALDALAAATPGVVPHPCDLTDAAQRARLISAMQAAGAGLDLVVHSAGVQFSSRIDASLQPERVEREISTNLLAPIMLSAALQPLLKAGERPLVACVSSGLSLAPKASAPVYCATKAGLSHFALGLRLQWEGQGIDVLDIVAPLVDTPMSRGREEMKMPVERFADHVMRALHQRPKRVYIGRARLLALLMRLWPSRAQLLLRGA